MPDFPASTWRWRETAIRWLVRDLGSKNGTFVNGVRITSPYPLGKNDRVTAGHIALDFGENSLPPASDQTVIFIEGVTPAASASTTVATSLQRRAEPGKRDSRAVRKCAR